MYLRAQKRPNGRAYLGLLQGYREGRTTRNRAVKSLSYLDELEKEHEDPIAHFKAAAEEHNARKRAEHAPVSLTIHPQKIDKRTCGAKNMVA